MVNTQQMNMFWQSKLFALIATLSGFARLRVIKILIYSKEIFPRWEQYACWIIDIKTRLQNAHMDSVCPRKSQVAFEKGIRSFKTHPIRMVTSEFYSADSEHLLWDVALMNRQHYWHRAHNNNCAVNCPNARLCHFACTIIPLFFLFLRWSRARHCHFYSFLFISSVVAVMR